MSECLRRVFIPLVGCTLLLLAGAASAEDKPPLSSLADQKNLIAGLCTTQFDLDAAGCACVAQHALDELDDNQRAYLVLSVLQPPAAEKMPIAQSKEELTTLFNFLAAAHDACAPAGATPPAAAGSATPQ